MKHAIVIILAAAAAALVGVVAYRLSVDALALIVGILLGIIALVPTVIVGGLLLRRSLEKREDERRGGFPQAPVVVVSGGYPQAMMPQPQPQTQAPPALMSHTPTPQRQYHILGFEEDSEAEDVQWADSLTTQF